MSGDCVTCRVGPDTEEMFDCEGCGENVCDPCSENCANCCATLCQSCQAESDEANGCDACR
jgi:hypothetical protein